MKEINFGDKELLINKDKFLEIWINARNPFSIILKKSWMRLCLKKISKQDIINFSKKYNFIPFYEKSFYEKSQKIKLLDSLVWHIGLSNLKPEEYNKYFDKLYDIYTENKNAN